MPKAYSYIRFSSAAQSSGDSVRRQKQLVADYVEKEGLELDTSITFHDFAVSSYHGVNAETGALGAFREAVKSGVVESGSYLLVEALDRISRQAARKSLVVLGDICDLGITVVTLDNGKKYDKAALDNDPMTLLLSIFLFIASNDESARKGDRVKKAWGNKRAMIKDRPLTGKCPAWLQLNPVTREFDLIEDRASIVRRIFDMYLKGKGQALIVDQLISENIEPFGNGKNGNEKKWHKSYIAKILQNPAVIGEFLPHTLDYNESTRKKVRVPLEPIKGYFPVIVDEVTFSRAQELKQGKGITGRKCYNKLMENKKALELQNMFSYVGKCPSCGANMIRANKSKTWVYLVCSDGKRGKCPANYSAVPYGEFENNFLNMLKVALPAMPTKDVKHDEYIRELSRLRRQLSMTEKQLGILTDKLASVDNMDLPKTILNRMKELEVAKELQEKKIKQKAWEVKSLKPTAVLLKSKELIACMHYQELNRERVNALLRSLCDTIVISKQAVALNFRHGSILNMKFGEDAGYNYTTDGLTA